MEDGEEKMNPSNDELIKEYKPVRASWVCQRCKKHLGYINTTRDSTLRRKYKTYDLYWFCSNDCIKLYEEEIVKIKKVGGKNEKKKFIHKR